MKKYEYLAVTDNEDDSLKLTFSNDFAKLEYCYGDYHWVKLSRPMSKLEAINEAKTSSSFDEHEKRFLEYESTNFDVTKTQKQKFFRVRKTKKEKAAEIVALIPTIRNSVFDVRIG